jgi:uncharacterized protein YhjY with autotransporter beta-barrel domain
MRNAATTIDLSREASIATDRGLQRPDCAANLDTAPKTIGVQATMMMPAAFDLVGAVMGRLDSERAKPEAADSSPASPGADGMMGLGMGGEAGKASKSAAGRPITVYTSGALLGGANPDSPNLAGYTYHAASGVLGLEYSANRYLILGLAGAATTTSTDLVTGADVGVSTVQAAAYLSYATKAVFIDALAAYGVSDLDVTRPVLGEVVRSSTDANALLLAIRGGYLASFGQLRVGPIAGLTYVNARIGGYTEKGGPSLVYTVAGQSFDLLTASAGIRFLAAFRTGGYLAVPYLNVTWEHQLGDSTHSFTAALAQPGAVPVSVSYPAFHARDYGKIEGGLTVELSPQASIGLGGASTFAGGGHDYRISAGLSFRF